jgi:thiol-disulfide isomerase/thioredoxin
MKKKQQNQLLFWGILIIVVVGFTALIIRDSGKPGKFTSLAQCLDEKGAKFYGAFWCPACESQRTQFGKAQNDLPYIECSNQDRSQTDICNNENIQSYPTWKFVDGSVITGVQSFEFLAEKTGCELP